jgi:hypothetical protein
MTNVEAPIQALEHDEAYLNPSLLMLIFARHLLNFC